MPNTAYRDHYNEQSFIDDKTWSDLNMDTLFHKINFNFTAIGEMRLYATLRGMFKVNQTSLINMFKENKVFRLNVSYILSKIGKMYTLCFQIKCYPLSEIFY